MRYTIDFMRRRIGGLLLMACLSLCGIATEARAADYTVELVVYANLQRDDGAEQLPTPRALPDTQRASMLGENGTRLLDGPRSLQAIADTLRRSGNHRLLLHWYWQQPDWGPVQAQPVHVQIPAGSTLPVVSLPAEISTLTMQQLRDSANGSTPTAQTSHPLLDGTVKLVTGDILQVDVDMVYWDLSTGLPTQLKESRRLRNGELHYLDHPRFGVLVRVMPVVATP